MSNTPKTDRAGSSSGGGATPVPPRPGKGGKRPGPGNRPSANRNPRGRQARQAAQRRNRLYGLIAVAAVVVIVAVVVVVGVSGGGSSGAPRQAAPAAAVTQLEGTSLQTMTAAASKVTQLNPAVAAQGGTLTSGGKPEVLYIGAEFCPICAAERWPMTIALMKFGTFSGLKQTHSAKSDGDAGTWSYYGATYTSKYLAFQPYEMYTNQPSGNYYKTLETPPKAAQSIWSANEGSQLSFPFIDFGGKYALTTSQYNPNTIYYHDFNYVLGAVSSNDNTIGASVNASAAVFTKYLCGLTNNQPSDVCSAVANVAAPVGSSSTGSSTPAG